MKDKLYQVDSGYYCAGLITRDDLVVGSAPILKWMIGKTITYVNNYCWYKRFKITEI